MEMLSLIECYKQKLVDNPNDYVCLLFALQIPSICSRIEFPQTPENTGSSKEGKLYKQNGDALDANLYKLWIAKHRSAFSSMYRTSMELNVFCDAIYDLRCKLTHEGILITNESHFYFTNGDRTMLCGNIIFMPIKQLCEAMFNTALTVLSNRQEKMNITPFSDIFVPDDIYSKIYKDITKTYSSFWDKYSADDNLLNCIYDHMILDNPNMKSEIDAYFQYHPDANFEVLDFGSKYGHIFDFTQKFIKQKHDEKKSLYSLNLYLGPDVLCLSKSEYERMLQVHQELETFSKSHPIKLDQYTKTLNKD